MPRKTRSKTVAEEKIIKFDFGDESDLTDLDEEEPVVEDAGEPEEPPPPPEPARQPAPATQRKPKREPVASGSRATRGTPQERRQAEMEEKDLPPPNSSKPSIGTIYFLLTKNQIDVNPPYQRDVVWNDAKQMNLIDSIWHNYTVPQLTFHRVTEGGRQMRTCIDGKQRLTSIRRFMDGEIPYKDTKTRKKYWYKKTDPKQRRLLVTDEWQEEWKAKSLAFEDYEGITENQERAVFQRVQLGTVLTPSEKLQAVNGPCANLVRDIREYMLGITSFNMFSELGKNRGKDFEAVCQIVHVISQNKVPTSLPEPEKLTTFLEGKTPNGNDLRDKVPKALKIFARLINHDTYGPWLDEKPITNVEFVLGVYVVANQMKKLTDCQLADALKQIWGYARSKNPNLKTKAGRNKSCVDMKLAIERLQVNKLRRDDQSTKAADVADEEDEEDELEEDDESMAVDREEPAPFLPLGSQPRSGGRPMEKAQPTRKSSSSKRRRESSSSDSEDDVPLSEKASSSSSNQRKASTSKKAKVVEDDQMDVDTDEDDIIVPAKDPSKRKVASTAGTKKPSRVSQVPPKPEPVPDRVVRTPKSEGSSLAPFRPRPPFSSGSSTKGQLVPRPTATSSAPLAPPPATAPAGLPSRNAGTSTSAGSSSSRAPFPMKEKSTTPGSGMEIGLGGGESRDRIHRPAGRGTPGASAANVRATPPATHQPYTPQSGGSARSTPLMGQDPRSRDFGKLPTPPSEPAAPGQGEVWKQEQQDALTLVYPPLAETQTSSLPASLSRRTTPLQQPAAGQGNGSITWGTPEMGSFSYGVPPNQQQQQQPQAGEPHRRPQYPAGTSNPHHPTASSSSARPQLQVSTQVPPPPSSSGSSGISPTTSLPSAGDGSGRPPSKYRGLKINKVPMQPAPAADHPAPGPTSTSGLAMTQNMSTGGTTTPRVVPRLPSAAARQQQQQQVTGFPPLPLAATPDAFGLGRRGSAQSTASSGGMSAGPGTPTVDPRPRPPQLGGPSEGRGGGGV